MPGVVAVGTFKVSVAPKHEGGGWKYEIHQIVSGAKKAELEKVFATSRRSSGNSLRVKEVTNLAQSINDVLKRNVQGWQHPYQTEITPDRPKKAQRAEYYEWLLGLSACTEPTKQDIGASSESFDALNGVSFSAC